MDYDGLPNSDDREYVIISRLTNKALDDIGKPTDETIPVVQWDYHGGLNQRWHFLKGRSNVYHIISCSSRKALDIRGGSHERGADVIQYNAHYGPNQSFIIEPVGDGYVRIRAVSSGKVLDIKGASYDNRAPIVQENSCNSYSQHWLLKDSAEGHFETISRNLGAAFPIKDVLPRSDKEYMIVSRLTKKALDDAGKPTDDIVPVIQWDCHGNKNQRWGFTKGQNNVYHIISCSSDKAMDVRGESVERGAEIIQYKPHYRSNQAFLIEPVDDGYVRIRSVFSGKVLDIQGESHDNRARIIQENCRDAHSQHWLLKDCTEDVHQTTGRDLGWALPKIDVLPKSDMEYMIVSRLTKKALDDAGKPTDDIIPVIQWDCHGNKNQRWRFVKGQNNAYYIISCSSGKALDICGGSHERGAEIIQYKPHYGPNQAFSVEPVGDGYVRIRSVLSGKVLDIKGESHDNHARIIQENSRDAHSQHWLLKDCIGCKIQTDSASPALVTVLPKNDGLPECNKDYRIESRITKQVLDSRPGRFGKELIYENNKNDSLSQRWRFTKADGNSFYITSCASGKAMGVTLKSKFSGKAIALDKFDPRFTTVPFLIQPVGDGYVRIVAAHSNLALDKASEWHARTHNTMEGFVPIVQSECHEGYSQHWLLK